MVGTNIDQYKKRNQSNPEKIKQQIVTGKLGEIAVSRLFGTNEPDFAIYEKKKKSFDKDLVLADLHLHVKTQDKESADKYGTSWTFQYSGGGFGHTDKLITQPGANDVAVFVTVDRQKLECAIFGTVRCMLLTQILSLPKLIQLYGSKRVVYAENIQPHHLFDLEGYAEQVRKEQNQNGETI